MLLISNELGTRAPDPSNNYAAGLVPNWKENTQFFVRLFFSPQQCGADRKINNSWVTVFLGNTPTCAEVNKPQDEQGPNWSLPQGFLRFVVVRQPQAGNFTRKIMVATAKGESPPQPTETLRCHSLFYKITNLLRLRLSRLCGWQSLDFHRTNVVRMSGQFVTPQAGGLMANWTEDSIDICIFIGRAYQQCRKHCN